MMRALNGISISRRLILISAMFTLPIAVMLALIVSNLNTDITFSDLELTGTRYLRPLDDAIAGLGEYRQLMAQSASGRPADSTRLTAVRNRIDQAFTELLQVNEEVGGDLQFTDAGLSLRDRGHVAPASVAAEWRAIGSAGGQMAADKAEHLIADMRVMFTHAGDTSNLILDPDLDSYYTMDAVLLAIPQTQDRLDAAASMMEGLAVDKPVTADDRTRLAVVASWLKEGDRDRILADVQTATKEDAGFYGASASLQQRLPSAASVYNTANTVVIQALEKGDAAGALKAIAQARETAKTLWTTSAEELDKLLGARLASLRSSRLQSIVVSLLVWIGALALVTVISRSISGPLKSMSTALETGAREVASTSGQVASSSQSLSQGATEQAASLEETSASMEEMASMTRKNAENSQTAAGLMGEVDTQVRQSNGALGEMVASMTAIEESSQQVAKIIKTIDEIAFQTNILALNAAVEAARAGEAGMGFAVVANEVRNLAQRSAQAAQDTAGLIEASVAKSQAGSVKVGQVAASITAITESVSKVKGLVDEVSVASRQQAQGIDQVSQAIAQMEKVTQTTAATAEESAAASEELSAQAETSLSIVQQLHTLAGGRAASTAPSHKVASAAPQRERPRRAA